jgi:hypothetical protein
MSDIERADAGKRQVVLTNAAIKLAEGLDDVKQVRTDGRARLAAAGAPTARAPRRSHAARQWRRR